jgi:hypothetical protein
MNWFESLALSAIMVAAIFICQHEAADLQTLTGVLHQPLATPLSAMALNSNKTLASGMDYAMSPAVTKQ